MSLVVLPMDCNISCIPSLVVLLEENNISGYHWIITVNLSLTAGVVS